MNYPLQKIIIIYTILSIYSLMKYFISLFIVQLLNKYFLLFRKMQAAAAAGADPGKQREYLKKKKQKKLQRFKELEEEREQEKNKWLAFTTKVNYYIQI